MEKIQKAITERVTAMRRSKGDKQVDLAAILDVDRSFIGKIESFRKTYNITHLNKIALHYGCDLYDLIPRKPVPDEE